jgi:hypothetical protein
VGALGALSSDDSSIRCFAPLVRNRRRFISLSMVLIFTIRNKNLKSSIRTWLFPICRGFTGKTSARAPIVLALQKPTALGAHNTSSALLFTLSAKSAAFGASACEILATASLARGASTIYCYASPSTGRLDDTNGVPCFRNYLGLRRACKHQSTLASHQKVGVRAQTFCIGVVEDSGSLQDRTVKVRAQRRDSDVRHCMHSTLHHEYECLVDDARVDMNSKVFISAKVTARTLISLETTCQASHPLALTVLRSKVSIGVVVRVVVLGRIRHVSYGFVPCTDDLLSNHPHFVP